MNIDRNLNLVVPVERDDGTTIYVHSSPIGREVFQRFFLVIAKTFSSIYGGGLNYLAGPRIAAMMLREIAKNMGQSQEVESLFDEMRRLTNVVQPNPADNRWMYVPMSVATDKGIISADDADEVENIVTYFTLASVMHKKKDARSILTEAAQLWSAQVTSFSCTAYVASLPTSTTPASTGAKTPPSLVPS